MAKTFVRTAKSTDWYPTMMREAKSSVCTSNVDAPDHGARHREPVAEQARSGDQKSPGTRKSQRGL